VSARVLLVDDHAPFLAALGMNLCARGYKVDKAGTASDAIATFDQTPSDIVLLDLGLPDRSGLEVVNQIRTTSRVPILIISACRDERDTVALLDAGADGYITKPFGLEELLARIRSLLRRPSLEQPSPTTLVITPDFEIDRDSKIVRHGETVVRLTPKEWEVIDYLMMANGRIVPQQELLTEVWGPWAVGNTTYVRAHLAHLRKKLEPDPSNPVYLITEPGRGVRFEH
jgi:two-component system KDP operon response regulator KdpE